MKIFCYQGYFAGYVSSAETVVPFAGILISSETSLLNQP